MLLALKGMGANFAAVLWSEAFYRQFANRRQVAAYAGLAATPWQSGGIRHEQGVSKAGYPRLRTTMIQVAWLWIGHQPNSALTRWFKERSPQGRKRAIVALARKLLVALWKYVTQGVVIEGAVMKTCSTPSPPNRCRTRWAMTATRSRPARRKIMLASSTRM